MVRGTLENENDPRTTANAIPTNTNGITEKFFGNHLNLSCLRFVSTKTTTIWTSSCSPVYHFPPKTTFTEHTIFDFTEKGKGSRGYLKKYLFSTPLHLDSLVDVYVFFVSLSPDPSLGRRDSVIMLLLFVPSLIDRMATVWLSWFFSFVGHFLTTLDDGRRQPMAAKPPRRLLVGPCPGPGHKSNENRELYRNCNLQSDKATLYPLLRMPSTLQQQQQCVTDSGRSQFSEGHLTKMSKYCRRAALAGAGLSFGLFHVGK